VAGASTAGGRRPQAAAGDGGELEDLSERFQQLGLFELVVAENGTLLDGLPDRPPTHVSEDLTGAITVRALLICVSVAVVPCAEHRRDTPTSRG
jgi:hypothetical protein